MAYATAQDMIDRFGQTEMTRLSVPADQSMDGGVDVGAMERVLEEVSATADSYLRKRYRTPLDVAPAEVRRVVCDMARFDLSSGEQKVPSEEVRARHKDALQWLRDVADGRVTLELDEVVPGEESRARVQTGDDVRWHG